MTISLQSQFVCRWIYRAFRAFSSPLVCKLPPIITLNNLLIFSAVIIVYFYTYTKNFNFQGSSYGRLLTLQKTKNHPGIEIFTAPPALDHENRPTFLRAISSWKKLQPQPEITVLGEIDNTTSLAVMGKVNHDPFVDRNFLGNAIFSSLVSRVNKSTADIAVLVNYDIILLQDFIQSIYKSYERFPHFFGISARYDVTEPIEYHKLKSNEFRSFVLSNGILNNDGDTHLWAWTIGGPRLVFNNIPPFIYSAGRYDRWFVNEVVTHNVRPVIDLSETALPIRLLSSKHTRIIHNNPLKTPQSTMNRNSRPFYSKNSQSITSTRRFREKDFLNFERNINIHLSHASGMYRDGLGTTVHSAWKMSYCFEKDGLCILRRHRPGLCHCEYTQSVFQAYKDPPIDLYGRPKTVIIERIDGEENDQYLQYNVPKEDGKIFQFGLPLTLEDALGTLSVNGTIIISAVNYGYRHVMMNWVCQMRRLGVNSYIIAALDKELYRYGIERGVPVYFEDSFEKTVGQGSIGNGAAYGSEEFKQLTKMKTRVVSRVLRLGLDVMWTDCDIVYFENPLPLLQSTSGNLVVQSNAPDGVPSNGIRRINSGFYLARSSADLIFKFDAVVRLALASNLTEQPCFYDVLCGTNGEYRLGADACIRDNVVTTFLDRNIFPNGATGDVWNSQPGLIRNKFPRAKIVHNNWVSGISKKQERMRLHGFLIFDSSDQICHLDKFSVPPH